MRVVDVSFSYDAQLNSEEELLKQHYITAGWAEALQRKGVEVIVVKRFSRENAFRENDVQYYFVKDKFKAELKYFQLPFRVFKKIVELDADLVHLHTFPSSFQIVILRFLLKKKTAIIIQNHGGKVATGIKARVNKFLSIVADGFFLTTTEQGRHWFNTQRQLRKVMPVMEGGTFFNYETRDKERDYVYFDRNIAREKTGMYGNPVFLWVGRLDDNKDPLTILNGIEILCTQYSKASLYMIYNEYDLLNEVKKRIEGSDVLKNSVHLLDAVAHEAMQIHYNSADYFVLGSHYEGSGYALSEALSCGCIPVVTNIPSFSMMTDNGALGALWETGNSNSFIEAVTKAMQKNIIHEASRCIEFYKTNLSFDAIASTAVKHYQNVINKRAGK
ncbi:glycosyltransferase family 4 protein [Panacibacter ginsenosidivorans]|uniref:Glycosyltransferase family 4 protein n=1 Tax=Panacibacter ginsenosidivorans TaxID=1813871 RepID=A0A5B8V5Z1_9BACT|nr:glycosyltransferase family 4 protein [Panacibacter ginsenosidivorans]QEC66171.1 glycosyltransferase family 4 protein [Panacibacter ginsenosidivorans]